MPYFKETFYFNTNGHFKSEGNGYNGGTLGISLEHKCSEGLKSHRLQISAQDKGNLIIFQALFPEFIIFSALHWKHTKGNESGAGSTKYFTNAG